MTLATTAGAAPARRLARGPVRVMVVDDSVVIRGLIERWLSQEKELLVVAKCANGQIAVDSVATAQPDVIILDIEMPVMDGLTALPKLLAAPSRPHVIVASTLTKRNAAITLKALSMGASECLPKPEGNSAITTSADFRREIVAKIRALGGLDSVVAQRIAARADAGRADAAKPAGQDVKAVFSLVPFNRVVPRALAIGSSTGGPKALATVLADIGNNLARVPIFITQHMPPTFTAMLAENLARASGRPAKEGAPGETPVAGTIYVAPGGKHMILRKQGAGIVIDLDDRPPVNFTKPSVDVMFDSIAEVYGSAVLSVVLTGMGADGAVGATNLRKVGANVIAQDEATSVVWGMPGATALTNMCSAVLPLGEIGGRVGRILGGSYA